MSACNDVNVNESNIVLLNGNHRTAESDSISFTRNASITAQQGERNVSKTVTSIESSPPPDGVFCITTNSVSLNVSNITFAINEGMNCPLFYLSAGILNLSNLDIISASQITDEANKNVTVSSSVLKFIRGNSSNSLNVTLDRCNFSGIHYSSPFAADSSSSSSSISVSCGGVIYAELGSNDALNISNSSITSCSADYGGGIFLSLSAKPSALSMEDLNFSSNAALNGMECGNTLFVNASYSDCINQSQFTPFMSCESDTSNQAYGSISGGSYQRLAHLVGFENQNCVGSSISGSSNENESIESSGSSNENESIESSESEGSHLVEDSSAEPSREEIPTFSEESGSSTSHGWSAEEEESSSTEYTQSCVYISANGSDAVFCGSLNEPCGSIGYVTNVSFNGSEEFSRWIVLRGGEHKKENESIRVNNIELKIKGEGKETVKTIGEIDAGEIDTGILYGDGATLDLSNITMKENSKDVMNVALVVWSGGYVNMSGVEIVRIEIRGSARVLEVNGTKESKMRECDIRYEKVIDDSSQVAFEQKLYQRGNEDVSLCAWDNGVIVLCKNERYEISVCVLNGTKNGGIQMKGDELHLNNCTFDGTADVNESYESVRHNLLCEEGGKIIMNGYNGEEIKKNTSLWIIIGDCSFNTSEEEQDSLLYVPILKELRYDNTNRRLTFSGEMMLGCNISYEIFYSDGTEYTSKPVSLNGAESKRESELSTTLENALFGGINYTVRLIFGMNNSATQQKRILWPGEKYEDEESDDSGGGETGGTEGRGSNKGVRSRRIIIGVVVALFGIFACVGVLICICISNRKRKRKRKRRIVGEMTEVNDDLLSDMTKEGEEKETVDSRLPTDSSLSDKSGSTKDQEEREENKDESIDNSSSYLTSTKTTTTDGKSIQVNSDVQWPLSEGIYNQNVTSRIWR